MNVLIVEAIASPRALLSIRSHGAISTSRGTRFMMSTVMWPSWITLGAAITRLFYEHVPSPDHNGNLLGRTPRSSTCNLADITRQLALFVPLVVPGAPRIPLTSGRFDTDMRDIYSSIALAAQFRIRMNIYVRSTFNSRLLKRGIIPNISS